MYNEVVSKDEMETLSAAILNVVDLVNRIEMKLTMPSPMETGGQGPVPQPESKIIVLRNIISDTSKKLMKIENLVSALGNV